MGKTTSGLLKYFKGRYAGIPCVLRSDKKIDLKNLSEISDFDEIYLGNCALDSLTEDVIFLSPSVRRERFFNLSERPILSSDAEFFLESTDSDVYAVTGSDGKSTTTKLISLLLEGLYDEAIAAGNIGVPLTPLLQKNGKIACVCELSSFQLNYFSPHVKRALITNISENHLDWHTSYEEYTAAKENLLKSAMGCVFNADDLGTKDLMRKYRPFAVYSAEKDLAKLQSEITSENYVYTDGDFVYINGRKILNREKLSHLSRHNTENFMAALAVTCDLPVEERALTVLRDFTGLSHRCERFGVYCGITFIDSSIDSSPKRTVTTLSSLDGKPIVILGGRSKGQDYSILPPVLKEKAKAIILTGETGRDILALINEDPDFSDFGDRIIYKSNFDDAVISAAAIASEGDTVILSPASTSFDRFSGFEERGEHFKKIIKKIYDYK